LYSRTEPMTYMHITFPSTVTVKQEADITGTAQFIPQHILLQAVNIFVGQLVHETPHNVESFIWVLSYSVIDSCRISTIRLLNDSC
ncbi:hypothetical protein BYT27DRAFT_7116987, partial [Phlegmacium glaucopus]